VLRELHKQYSRLRGCYNLLAGCQEHCKASSHVSVQTLCSVRSAVKTLLACRVPSHGRERRFDFAIMIAVVHLRFNGTFSFDLLAVLL
jgi:hypothetical protein